MWYFINLKTAFLGTKLKTPLKRLAEAEQISRTARLTKLGLFFREIRRMSPKDSGVGPLSVTQHYVLPFLQELSRTHFYFQS